MDVSEDSGTPKSSILIGFSIINHPFWGTTIFGNTQIGPKTPSWQIWHRNTSCVCIPRWWHRGSRALKSFRWKFAVPYQLPIEAPTRTQWPQGELLEVVVAQKINRTFRLVDLQRQGFFPRFCLENLCLQQCATNTSKHDRALGSKSTGKTWNETCVGSHHPGPLHCEGLLPQIFYISRNQRARGV